MPVTVMYLLPSPPLSLSLSFCQVLQWPMLQLAVTEVVSGVSGETEEKIRNLFQRAKVVLKQLPPLPRSVSL